MSDGLQVFDASGNLMLDISDRLTRLHGIYPVVAAWNVNSGFVSVPGMVDDGSWHCFANASYGVGTAQPIYMGVASGGFNWMRFGLTGALNIPVGVLRV